MTDDSTSRGITPSQTVGPFFAYALTPQDYDFPVIFPTDLTQGSGVAGTPIRIEGRVLDGDGEGISDAMIEIWQADPGGRYALSADRRAGNTGFAGFGRAPTGGDGSYAFTTVKPGRVPGPDGALQAPHVSVTLFARGMLRHVVTRIYFEDEPANAEDAVLALVPAARRDTLLARRTGEGVYRFDIRVQGGDETVFFDA